MLAPAQLCRCISGRENDRFLVLCVSTRNSLLHMSAYWLFGWTFILFRRRNRDPGVREQNKLKAVNTKFTVTRESDLKQSAPPVMAPGGDAVIWQ